MSGNASVRITYLVIKGVFFFLNVAIIRKTVTVHFKAWTMLSFIYCILSILFAFVLHPLSSNQPDAIYLNRLCICHDRIEMQ